MASNDLMTRNVWRVLSYDNNIDAGCRTCVDFCHILYTLEMVFEYRIHILWIYYYLLRQHQSKFPNGTNTVRRAHLCHATLLRIKGIDWLNIRNNFHFRLLHLWHILLRLVARRSQPQWNIYMCMNEMYQFNRTVFHAQCLGKVFVQKLEVFACVCVCSENTTLCQRKPQYRCGLEILLKLNLVLGIRCRAHVAL